eukprot:7383100-Prymnesium_polylepis.2
MSIMERHDRDHGGGEAHVEYAPDGLFNLCRQPYTHVEAREERQSTHVDASKHDLVQVAPELADLEDARIRLLEGLVSEEDFDHISGGRTPDAKLQKVHQPISVLAVLLHHELHAQAVAVAHNHVNRVVSDPESPKCTWTDDLDDGAQREEELGQVEHISHERHVAHPPTHATIIHHTERRVEIKPSDEHHRHCEQHDHMQAVDRVCRRRRLFRC